SRETKPLLHLLQAETEGKPIVAWGESGQGKSWLFYRTARELALRGNIAIVLDSTQDVLRDRQEAARLFCERIWGTDEPLSLDRLARKVRSQVPDLPNGVWLNLLIDGLKDTDYLPGFAGQEWDAIGIHVAVAFTSDRDKPSLPDNVHSLRVREFSSSE